LEVITALASFQTDSLQDNWK